MLTPAAVREVQHRKQVGSLVIYFQHSFTLGTTVFRLLPQLLSKGFVERILLH